MTFKAEKMTKQVSLFFAVLISSFIALAESRALDTISIAGRLSSEAAVINSNVIPAVSSAKRGAVPTTTTLYDILAISEFYFRVGKRDAGGKLRSLYFVFFHVSQSNYLCRVYVKSDGIIDQSGKLLQAVNAKGSGDINLLFNADGERSNPSQKFETILLIPWKNGSTRIRINQLDFSYATSTTYIESVDVY